MNRKSLFEFKNSFLRDYCDRFAFDPSFVRGLEYYNENRILHEWKSPTDKNERSYSVKGHGSIYNVKVKNLYGKNFSINCDCPYNFGGMCKHQVAILMLIDRTSDPLEMDSNNGTSTKNRCTIWTPDQLNSLEISSCAFDNGYSDNDFDEFNFSITKIQENKIIAEVSTLYSYYNSKNPKVEISYFPDGIHIDCNCKQWSKNVCKHKLVALRFLIKEHFFPAVIIPDQRKKVVTDIMKSYGLKGEIHEKDFLHFFVTRKGNISIEMNPRYKGLQPIDEDDLDVYRDSFLSNTSAMGYEKIDLPELPVEEDVAPRYNIGYVLSYITDHLKFNFQAIAGKLNKTGTGLLSNFQYYDTNCTLAIDENDADEKLIILSQKILPERVSQYFRQKGVDVNNTDDITITIEHIQYLMRYLPSIIEHLSKQPFVYIRRGNEYDIDTLPLKKKDLTEVKASTIPVTLFYQLSENELFVELEAMVEINGEEYSLDDDRLQLLNQMLLKSGNTIHLMKNLHHALAINNSLEDAKIKMVKDHFPVFINEYIVPLSKTFEIKSDHLESYNMQEIIRKPIKKKLYISGMGNFVLFKPVVEYEKNNEFELLRKGTPISVNGHIIHKSIRDTEYEDTYEKFLKTLHPSFEKQYPNEFYNLKVDQMVDNFWFFEAFEKLQNFDVEIYGLNDLKNFKYNTSRGTINTNLKSGKDWFEVDIAIAFGDNQVSLKEIRKAILKKERYIRLADNSIGILPQEWFDKFNRYLRVGEIKNNQLLISKKKFPIIEELFDDINDLEIINELAEKKKMLKEFDQIKDVELPAGINAELRAYQKEGYNWLCFLDRFKWGGILADDMGLGKTLQVITFLKKVTKKSKKPSLIIVPTTLIFNWQNELEKFCPSMTVLYHYGVSRQKETDHFGDYQLVITTYGLVINDIELLEKVDYNYIILDESQAIKNPSSKRFKAVSILKANNRIAMTGTPIENNTFDLYAQMSFVNPGFLGNATQFRDRFSNPIDRDRNTFIANELQQTISPFVIRRTKEQVATELPPKTEDVIYCTMDEDQRKVYDAYRNKIRNQLLDKIETEGIGKAKMHVLEGLLKLRQICDSPALLSDDENYGDDSVKIKELIRHITRKTANHKLVVFSQFVQMLSLIKKEVDNLNIEYEYLDGQCNQNQRKASVDHFQEDDNCRLFLISLKAGGTGINLTAADYVYIVDPWWNPAVENQAIDRCYRIGQDKKVFAYRMICKDTIEEKISQYQQQKKAVAENIIQTEESFMKQLTKEDVTSIFS
jgi:SNF2 family DNA or RNA helicase